MSVAVAPTLVMKRRGTGLSWLTELGMGASILVAALSAAFGVILVETTGYIGALLLADPAFAGSGSVLLMVTILSAILTGVALYVAAVVTANTFSTIIAGRTPRIALYRLIGASSRTQRREVAGQGLVVGLIGALLGIAIGVALSWAGVMIGAELLAGAPRFDLGSPAILIPAVAVVLTTWLAAWSGSRPVLNVTPLQGLSGAQVASSEEISSRSGRKVVSFVLVTLGALLLAGGVVLGLFTSMAILVAFVGGLLSFTGLVLGATWVLPPLLRAVAPVFGSGASARLAAGNASRYPERTSRMAIGVVVGVTLVTMFAVALESVKRLLAAGMGGQDAREFSTVIDSFSAVMMVLVGVSAVIAAVGLVNLLTIGIVQRRRELGLLRAMGLSNRQVRVMVLIEAAHITVTATVTGLLLGVLYGWVAAQSLLGAVSLTPGEDPPGLLLPSIPWIPLIVIAGATAILTLVATVTPTRLATRVAPVEALKAD